MSAMGGFDVIVQFSADRWETIQDFIEYKFKMGYGSVLEVPIHFNIQGVEGTLYVIINDVNIKPNSRTERIIWHPYGPSSDARQMNRQVAVKWNWNGIVQGAELNKCMNPAS